jgi:V/A-type H+/Na+-transporting ATPase subunit E
MTKQLDKGEDKIQQICDLLKVETLEPAKQEAEGIVDDAKQKADKIINDAEAQAKELIREAHETIERERSVFHSALEQAAAQCFEALKQRIQNKLFDAELDSLIRKEASSAEVAAKLISAIVKGLEKEGTESDLSAIVSQNLSVDEVNKLLAENILNKLAENSVSLGSFAAGAQVKLIDKRVTLDVSDQVLKELLSNYLRKDFRELIFQA